MSESEISLILSKMDQRAPSGLAGDGQDAQMLDVPVLPQAQPGFAHKPENGAGGSHHPHHHHPALLSPQEAAALAGSASSSHLFDPSAPIPVPTQLQLAQLQLQQQQQQQQGGQAPGGSHSPQRSAEAAAAAAADSHAAAAIISTLNQDRRRRSAGLEGGSTAGGSDGLGDEDADEFAEADEDYALPHPGAGAGDDDDAALKDDEAGLPGSPGSPGTPADDASPRSGKPRGRKPKSTFGAGLDKDSKEYQRLRKENHKNVEKKRRETINDGIKRLSYLVPGADKNKSKIIAQAADYIADLRAREAESIEKWTLDKLITEQNVREIRTENDELRAALERRDLQIGELRRMLSELSNGGAAASNPQQPPATKS